ncbi:MAG: hypothetical protein PHF35_04680 [Candidatus Moranbacteria bacterium]|nr:hypothetical protein [Candidatus Moranbacteria bacterium]
MRNKKNILILTFLVLVAIGLIALRQHQQKNRLVQNENPDSAKKSDSLQGSMESEDNAVNFDEQDKIYEQFEADCQSGQWKVFNSVSGDAVTLSGKLRRVYPEDSTAPAELRGFGFYIEGSANTPLSGSNLADLELFEDRDVEVQGAKSEDGKSVEVEQVRCAGTETDKAAINSRIALMNWIAENINSIAPQKAPYQKWTVDTADFVDENHVYVEYYDAAEDDENSNIDVDTSRKVLLETSPKEDGTFNFTVMAYWEMGDDDYVLKSGADKFENVWDVMTYQYDPDGKSWTRI